MGFNWWVGYPDSGGWGRNEERELRVPCCTQDCQETKGMI
jgi:hypothetical protein